MWITPTFPHRTIHNTHRKVCTMAITGIITFVCAGCHTEVTRRSRKTTEPPTYCTHACYADHKRRTSMTVRATRVYFPTCPGCDQIHCTTRPSQRYCAPECRYTARLGQLNSWYWYAHTTGAGFEPRRWRKALIWWMRERDGDTCHICQNTRGPIQWDMKSGPLGDPTGMGPSIDHITPQSKGGGDEVANLALSHWLCNRERKANPLPDAQLVLSI